MAAGLYDITNEVLGKGHFAVVKLARHCLTGESVAIKIIDKAKLAREGLGQLRHEIRLWSILSEHEHPNVVKLYQCIDTRTKLYLVMEYCGGKVCDLFDHIQRRNGGNGLVEREARHIFREVCSAIHYCHSLRIVHRDLKPENILIIADTQGGFELPKVKLIDFGFSNQWSRDSSLLRTSCGSLAYSAPEILLGNHYNAPMIDIWSLGCILYILVYGSNPFMQCTDSETLIKILDCSFETPTRDTVSDGAIDLIRGLLRKEPDDRLTIEKVVKHPWFDDEAPEAEPSSNKQKSKQQPSELSVNDQIIETMIVRGITLSKDAIREMLLEQSGSEESTTGATHPHHSPQCHNNETSAEVNHSHYVRATYQLLKDKGVRESRPSLDTDDPQRNDDHDRVRSFNNKRGKLGVRKSLLNNNNTTTNSSSASHRLLSALRPPELAPLPESSNGGLFALPLARKCSVVSEEGLATESNTPEPPATLDEESPLSSAEVIVTESPEHIAQRSLHGTSSPTLLVTDTSEPTLPVKPRLSILHPVSSSPDFLGGHLVEENEDDDEQENESPITHENITKEEKYSSGKSCSIPVTGESIFERFRRKQPMGLMNVRISKSRAVVEEDCNNTISKPSVRVITQSKSLNNITLAETVHTGPKQSNGNSSSTNVQDVKLVSSMSAASIGKMVRGDKADCCVIS